MKFHFILFISIVFLLFSCKKDNNPPVFDIYGIWEATDFMSVESEPYPKTDGNNPKIEFKKDGTIAITLDINSCFSSFTLNGETGLFISDTGCTEICCDSEFSVKFVEMLVGVDNYAIENSTLNLIVPGWGWIVLRRVSG